MCIIACKPEGISMPSDTTILNMWTRNPDGAGLMYAVNGKVYIEKGFMAFEKLNARLKELDRLYKLKDLSVVMHFRITTHGGTKPENTHPFPISDSMGMLKKLRVCTKVGVAHNGIIDITPRTKDISDTMEYIAGELAPLYKACPKFYKDRNLMQMVDHRVDGKMAFLTGDGKIYTVGKFEESEGIMYSNSSYEPWSYRYFDYVTYDYDNCSYGWKNDKVNYCGYTISVMWLDDAEGEYVVDSQNNLYDGEFAIDAGENVYEYDYETDTLILAYGCEAYNSEGMPLRYNPDSDMISRELVVY